MIAIKGQVLTDFIADFTSGITGQTDQLEGWVLNVDGASNSKEVGVKIIFVTLDRSIIEQSFILGFLVSNKKMEYETS